MKKLVRLTESDLHRIVKESVNRILREYDGDDYFAPNYGEKRPEDIIDRLPSLSDNAVKKIIDGYFDPSYFESDYSDGFDDYYEVIDAAKEEYARRHKDFANKLFTQMNKPTYPQSPLHDEGYYKKHRESDMAWNEHDKEIAAKRLPNTVKKNGEELRKNWEKGLERDTVGTSQADKRPLHRKGSLNRAFDD